MRRHGFGRPGQIGHLIDADAVHAVCRISAKPGAAGNIGAEAAFKAEPDGYTLLSAPPPPLVVNQTLYPNLPFNPSEFAPVAILARVPNALVVNPARIPEKTVAAFIARAKANPGQLTTATTGNGGTQHVYSANGTTIYFTIPSYLTPCDLITDPNVACPAYVQQVTTGSYPIYVTNQNGSTQTIQFYVSY